MGFAITAEFQPMHRRSGHPQDLGLKSRAELAKKGIISALKRSI